MATVRVNGEDLDLPTLASLTLDDAMVVTSYTSLTLDQLEDLEGIHPGVLAALVHIAVQRANPDIKPGEIKKAVGALNLRELIGSVTEEDEGEAVPDLAQEPSRSSGGSEPFSGSGSGTSSEPTPDESNPSRSGTPALASVESLPARSAV